MKTHTLPTVLVLLLLVIGLTNLHAQTLIKEVSLKKQIDNSSLVVEGKVISKKSFWDAENKNIYTANTVQVFKVFKGHVVETIEVITKGGTIGFQNQLVIPNLKLQEGDVGVFTLYKGNLTALVKNKSDKQFEVYSSLQGFYKDQSNNLYSKKGVSNSFYKDIMDITGVDYIQVVDASTHNVFSKSSQVLIPTALTFSPATVTAGTKTTITITIPGGASGNFGSTQGKVGFINADSGGVANGNLDFINALDTQVISWTANSITVEVPSVAGTGKIRVTDASSNSIVSVSDLTVTYSEINGEFEVPSGSGKIYAYPTRHVNNDGSGGYVFRLQTSFNNNAPAKAAFQRALDTWGCKTGVNFTLGSTVASDAIGVNIIRFDVGAELPDGILAQTTYTFSGCDAANFKVFASEIDMVFDTEESWYYGTGLPGIEIDFESVALHELGHARLLGHVIDNSPYVSNGNDVMNYTIGYGAQQRVLSSTNIVAATDVQNRSISSTPICFGKQPMSSHPCSLGIEEEALNASIEMYPNPTTGEFTIKNTALVTLEKIVIYDISGRLISKFDMANASQTKAINLFGASRGMYFVNIHSDRAMITKKIILE